MNEMAQNITLLVVGVAAAIGAALLSIHEGRETLAIWIGVASPIALLLCFGVAWVGARLNDEREQRNRPPMPPAPYGGQWQVAGERRQLPGAQRKRLGGG